jgi:hypothetical protein
MVAGLPEWLLTELNAIEDVKLRNRLAAGLQIAIYETVRDLLGKLSAVRHLMLYFNTYGLRSNVPLVIPCASFM